MRRIKVVWRAEKRIVRVRRVKSRRRRVEREGMEWSKRGQEGVRGRLAG